MTRRRGTTDAPPPSAAALTPGTTESADRQAAETQATSPTQEATAVTASGDLRGLDAAILKFLRRSPNKVVDLGPLAQEIGADPFTVQLEVERLHQRRMVVAPFIEPGAAGGAELTEKGLRWLIDYEGGKPSEVPVALKIAKKHVRAGDEAARLPRAQVYGLKQP
jgi:hypothetical protein